MRALDSYGSDLILQTVLTDPGGSGSSFPCLCLADGDAFKLFPVKKKQSSVTLLTIILTSLTCRGRIILGIALWLKFKLANNEYTVQITVKYSFL